jgi:hypothetical protein
LMMMRRLFRLVLWECDAVYRHQCLSESGGDVYRTWNYYTTFCWKRNPFGNCNIYLLAKDLQIFFLLCFACGAVVSTLCPRQQVKNCNMNTHTRANQRTDGSDRRERPRSMTTARL